MGESGTVSNLIQVICRRHVLNLPPGVGKMMINFSARYVVLGWELRTNKNNTTSRLHFGTMSQLSDSNGHFPLPIHVLMWSVLQQLGVPISHYWSSNTNSSQSNFSYFMFCVNKKKLLFWLKISIIIKLKYLDQMQPSQCWRNSPSPLWSFMDILMKYRGRLT